MYVGINQLVFVGLFVEVHTLPLTTHAIVWEIVEHTVNTVAAQGDIVFGGAFSEQRSIDVQACIAMEIDGGALADGQRSSFGNSQTAIDNKWLLCRDGGVITYDGVTKNRRIPWVGIKVYLLLNSAFKHEDKVVVHFLRFVAIVYRRRQFYENANTILVTYLDIGDLESCRGT